jgi:hypothetical protein
MKATAILLVETSTIKVGGSTGKRKADAQITPASTSEQPAMDSESLPGDYNDPIVPKSETPLKQIKINGEVVEKALVDFVMTDECRRKVLNRHYGNDTIDEPPPCCDRCNIPPPSDNCDGCDICKPSLLQIFDDNPQVKPKRPANVKKTVLSPDDPLRIELEDWREVTYRNVYGGSLGGEALLDDMQIRRIGDLVKGNHVKTLDDLKARLDWAFLPEHGEELFKLIQARSLPALIAEEDKPKPTKPTRSVVCSSCKEAGHMSKCLEWPVLNILTTRSENNKKCKNYATNYPPPDSAVHPITDMHGNKENLTLVPRQPSAKRPKPPILMIHPPMDPNLPTPNTNINNMNSN